MDVVDQGVAPVGREGMAGRWTSCLFDGRGHGGHAHWRWRWASLPFEGRGVGHHAHSRHCAHLMGLRKGASGSVCMAFPTSTSVADECMQWGTY